MELVQLLENIDKLQAELIKNYGDDAVYSELENELNKLMLMLCSEVSN